MNFKNDVPVKNSRTSNNQEHAGERYRISLLRREIALAMDAGNSVLVETKLCKSNETPVRWLDRVRFITATKEIIDLNDIKSIE